MRDSQRSKVYRAERGILNARARKLLTRAETVAFVERVMLSVSIEGARLPERVDGLYRGANLRPGDRAMMNLTRAAYEEGFEGEDIFRVYLMNSNNRRTAWGGRHQLILPIWARKRWVIIHECAHAILQRSTWGRRQPWHGPAFCALYVRLLREFVTKAAGDELARLFDEGGVDRFPVEPLPLAEPRMAAAKKA